eukprot:TRINITY_DN11249_c0_g1_i1.p1 TRINITY_DN11249_c0_g1~~TRINITY_DN11249_c0_g1_i1.p1  ORF type:complete len:157 (-),score=6.76 TRINITY_DN11249_c0_g1_i1:53-523(-)
MPTARCRICGQKDDLDRLCICCDCYKKSDSNRVHKECLEQILAQYEGDEVPSCEVCRRPYRVKVEYRFSFDWRRFLSLRALSHCFEFFSVLFGVVCTILSLYMLSLNGELQRSPTSSRYLIYFMVLLTNVLVIFTLKKVYDRWKKANAQPEIVEVV